VKAVPGEENQAVIALFVSFSVCFPCLVSVSVSVSKLVLSNNVEREREQTKAALEMQGFEAFEVFEVSCFLPVIFQQHLGSAPNLTTEGSTDFAVDGSSHCS
jgi:HJR/Mrr/RecB family endonuclease